jgi:hypothetical protein
MPENLDCKDQKVTTDKFRERFDNIKWEKDEPEKGEDNAE